MNNLHPLTVFTCPPHCAAGGPVEDGGHLFDRWATSWGCDECGYRYMTDEPPGVASICPQCFRRSCTEGGGWSMVCSACGLTAMDWTLMRPAPACDHQLVRNARLPCVVSCKHCGEGTHYLFGFPGSKDARALGCRCSGEYAERQSEDGYTDREWIVEPSCKLHMPAEELKGEACE